MSLIDVHKLSNSFGNIIGLGVVRTVVQQLTRFQMTRSASSATTEFLVMIGLRAMSVRGVPKGA